MKLGLPIDAVSAYETEIKNLKALNNKLHEKLELLSTDLENYHTLLTRIKNDIEPFSSQFQFQTPEDIILKSGWSDKVKNDNLNLLKKYRSFCQEKSSNELLNKGNSVNSSKYYSIFNPDNIYLFVHNGDYSRTTSKKHFETLLNIIKRSTKNPFLSCSFPMERFEKPKLKHLITNDELIRLLTYLRVKKLDEIFLIVELLYKFGIRIGAASKLKVKDINTTTREIKFTEKFGNIITRELLFETYNKLISWIKMNKLLSSDYIFFPKVIYSEQYKRDKYISTIVQRELIKSNVFPKTTLETISSHCFRVTKAIKTYLSEGLERAARELNHRSSDTTKNRYIDAERRNLYKNVEKKLYSQNDPFKNKLKDLNEDEKENEINISIEEDESDIGIDDINVIEVFKERDDFGKIDGNQQKLNKRKEDTHNSKEIVKWNRNIADEEEDSFKYNFREEKFNILYIKANNQKSNKNSIESKINELKKTFREEKLEFVDNISYDTKIDFSPEVSSKKSSLFSLTKEGNNEIKTFFINEANYFYRNIQLLKCKGNEIGVFATQNIKPMQLICMVCGKIIFQKAMAQSMSRKKENKKRNLFWLLIKTKNSKYNRLIDQTNRANISTFIRAVSTKKSNCNVYPVIYNSLVYLIILASKPIEKKHELLVDNSLIYNIDIKSREGKFC